MALCIRRRNLPLSRCHLTRGPQAPVAPLSPSSWLCGSRSSAKRQARRPSFTKESLQMELPPGWVWPDHLKCCAVRVSGLACRRFPDLATPASRRAAPSRSGAPQERKARHDASCLSVCDLPQSQPEKRMHPRRWCKPSSHSHGMPWPPWPKSLRFASILGGLGSTRRPSRHSCSGAAKEWARGVTV